jgi:hypothetical protein
MEIQKQHINNEEIKDEIFLKKICDSDKKLLNLIVEIIVKIILEEDS